MFHSSKNKLEITGEHQVFKPLPDISQQEIQVFKV